MWFPSSKTCNVCGTVNPNLKRERMWTCPDCGTRHDRNLNAAINLRNLIVAPNRRRNGRGQEAVVQQKPWDSPQSEPGIVKDGPPIPEWERGTDAGTEVESPARGSRNSRSLNAAINPIKPPRRRQNGQGQEEVPEPGPLTSRQGHPGSVPKRKDRPHLRGHGREPGMNLDKRRPQAPGVEAGITESRPRQSA